MDNSETDVQALKLRKAAEHRRRAILSRADERLKKLKGYSENVNKLESEVEHTEDPTNVVDVKQRCSNLKTHGMMTRAAENSHFASQLEYNVSNNCNIMAEEAATGQDLRHARPARAKSAADTRHVTKASRGDESDDDSSLVGKFHVAIVMLMAVFVRLVLSSQVVQSLSVTQPVLPVFVGMEIMMLFAHRKYIQKQVGDGSNSSLKSALAACGITSVVFNAYSRYVGYVVVVFEDFSLFFVSFVFTHCVLS